MLRECIYDIEVFSEHEFPQPEEAKFPICSITIYDNFTDRYYSIIISSLEYKKKTTEGNWDKYYVRDERSLIIFTIKLLRFLSPDVLYGWYSDSFDTPYLFNRCQNLEMKKMLDSVSQMGFVNIKRKSISGMNVFDLIIGDKKIKKRSSYSLENVAIEEGLPIKKTEQHSDIMEIYKKDKDRFLLYNKSDVEILVELNKKNKIIPFFENVRTFAGLNSLEESLKNSVIVDTVALRRAHKEGFILPSKPTAEEKEEFDDEKDLGGALVKVPPVGIHRNVIVLDMAKFYPKILDLLNLSSETVLRTGLTKEQIDLKTGNIYVEYEPGVYVEITTKKKGFMPSLYQEFLKERLAVEAEMKKFIIGSSEYEYLMQKRQTIKDTSNSLPGVNGYTGFRMYNPVIANCITFTGKKMIAWTDKRLTSIGHFVAYADTDSQHVRLDDNLSLEEVVKKGDELSDSLSHDYIGVVQKEFNVKSEEAFEIDFEKAFKTIIYIRKDNGEPAKKRYAAREFYEKGKYVDVLYVRGFEIRRSDAPAYAKKLQEQVFKLLLWDHPKDEVIKYVKDMVAGFRAAPLSDIGVPKGINFNLESYGGLNKNGKTKGVPAQIKGAIYSNTHLGTNFGGGSKVKYLYVKKMPQNLPPTDVISFENENTIPKDMVVDYDRMIKLVIRQKIERVLAAAGISWESEIEGKKNLFDFED